MQQITPCLWFNNQAEEAVNFYVSLFKNSKILETTYYDKASSEASGMREGNLLTIVFELNGQKFLALNGGPVFNFTPAISFSVDCKDQAEVDHYWYNLCEGGSESQCGWLTDKYGLSWQIVPVAFEKMMKDKDSAKVMRVTKAMLEMTKLDIAELQRAFDGEE